MQTYLSTRTQQTRKKSDALIRVQYELYESWSAPADSRHRMVILLASGCTGTLTWDTLPKRALAGSASAGQISAQVPARHIPAKPIPAEAVAASDVSGKQKSGKRTVAGAAVNATSASKQRHALTGQQVVFIEKQTPVTLCFEARMPLLVVSFTNEFLTDFAPCFAWRGVLIKSCLDALKTDMRIGTLLEFARELHQCELAAQREGIASTPAGIRRCTVAHPHYVHALGFMLAAHLLCACQPTRPGATNGGLTPAQLQKAQNYIDAHFKETIRIAALYRAVGLGRKIFGKRFKTTTGMVPRQYILTRRVAYAQGLLREGRLRRSEIAAEAGFADQSHMGRCLRRVGNGYPSPISPRRRAGKLPRANTPFVSAEGGQ